MSVDEVEDLLVDAHKSETELTPEVEDFLSKLRTEVIVTARKKSKVPALCVYHKLQLKQEKQKIDPTKGKKLHPLVRMRLQHFREILKYL